ncbi:MAG: alpha/beta hydrolase [Christensenellaceae bacterium]|jgi:acetyl esterase/lipase|nr:alpha/beta hydrolase [Christensenellaceae bacterium]
MNKAELFFAITSANGDPMSKKHYPNAARIHKVSNISYGEDEKQKYDIFYDKTNNETKPILINIHGGGFVNGDKSYRDYLCNMFADSGWFVVNANYRLCPKVRSHDQIRDIYSVLGEIPSLKICHDIDDRKVVMTGDSAGAYLASYMEAILTNPPLRQKYRLPELDTKLSGLMLYSGPYDLPKLLSPKIFLNMAKDIGSVITGIKSKEIDKIKKYEFYDYLSLPQYVNEKWCPTMLSYSAKDVFTKGQGEHLQAVLAEKNVPIHTHIANTIFDNHCYHLAIDSPASQEALSASLEFLHTIKHGKKKQFIFQKTGNKKKDSGYEIIEKQPGNAPGSKKSVCEMAEKQPGSGYEVIKKQPIHKPPENIREQA